MTVDVKTNGSGLRPRNEVARSGFTVFEVLVVIAILALMAITVAISVNAIT